MLKRALAGAAAGAVELMRQGAIDEVLDVNYDASSWMAIGALAEFYARNAPLPDEVERRVRPVSRPRQDERRTPGW